MTKRYEDVINNLEMIKANLLDPNADYEATEKINELIQDLNSYEVIEGSGLTREQIQKIKQHQKSLNISWERAYEIWNEDTTYMENGE